MVSTRSGRVVSAVTPAETLVSDGQVEVKSTRRRATASKKTVDPEQVRDALEQQAPQQAHQEPEPSQESEPDEPPVQSAFKVVTVVTPKSVKSTPGSNASPGASRRTDFISPASNAKTDRGAVRRLSMNEVQDAAQVPLPNMDVSSDEPDVQPFKPRRKSTTIPAPRSRRSSPSTSLLLLPLIALPLTLAFSYYLLCHPSPTATFIPPHWRSTAQPTCTQVNTLWADTTARINAEATRPHTPLNKVFLALSHAKETTTAWAAHAKDHYTHVTEGARTQWAAVGGLNGIKDCVQVKFTSWFDSLTRDPKAYLTSLLDRLSTPTTTVSCADVLPAEALQALLVQGPGLPHVQDIYQHHTAVQHHAHVAAKGTGILIPCGPGCEDVAGAVVAGAINPKHVLIVDGSGYTGTEGAGALQAQLATFLSAAPAGVVVVTRLIDMEAPSLVVLSNAMSEGGSLQLKGRSVPTSCALYLGLLPLDVLGTDDTDSLESKVKAQLQAVFVSKSEAAGEAAGALALALRRRFDYVLPSLTALTQYTPEQVVEEAVEQEAAGEEQVVDQLLVETEEVDADVPVEDVATEL